MRHHALMYILYPCTTTLHSRGVKVRFASARRRSGCNAEVFLTPLGCYAEVTTSWVFGCCVLFFNQTAPALPVSTSPCIAGAPWSSAAHAPTASASSQRSHCRRPQVLATETAITKRTNAANQACRGATGYDVRAHTHMDAETHHTPHTSITAVRAFHAPGGHARPRVIYPV